MRSRYTAFALGAIDYLLQTWHVDHRPNRLEHDDRIRWIGLEILHEEQQGDAAVVEFEAQMLVGGVVSAMRERSDFLRQQGGWLYTSGQQLTPSSKPWKPTRKQACPCGSGARFKRCCGGGA